MITNSETLGLPSRVSLGDFNPAVGFKRGASALKLTLWYLAKMLFFLNAFPFPSSLKVKILRSFGAKVGEGVVIKPRVNIHFPWKLNIGDHVWIGEECFILNFEPINIGSNVCVSQRVFLCAGNHDYRHPAMPYRNAPITLQDGCWVGACSFVSPGSVIGVDSIIAACSVVSGITDANSVYKGPAACRVKSRWD